MKLVKATTDLLEQEGSPTETARSDVTISQQVDAIRENPVAALVDAAGQSGFTAQLRQLLVVILSCLSAAAKSIFHVHLVGPYSAGKSTVAQAGAQIVGEQFVVSSATIWTITAPALARMNGRLRGRGLILDERTPNKELEGLLRLAASGFPAVRTITVGGIAVDLLVEPKFAVVEAMLDDKDLGRQDRSRYLRVRMPTDNDSRAQISVLSRERFMIAGMRRKQGLEEFARAFQIFLAQLDDNLQVEVPFATLLDLDSPSRIRDRLLGHPTTSIVN